MLDFDSAYILAAALVSGGAAWGGAKVTMNGTKGRVEKLETEYTQVIDRLARIETKLDMLLKD